MEVFIIIIITLILTIPLIIISIKENYIDILFNRTIIYCKNYLGHLIAIIGKIRVGKSTLLSGITHVFQIIIINDNNDIMDRIRRIFYDIDFNEFDNIILYLYYEKKIYDLDKITLEILKYYNYNGYTLRYNYLDFKTIKTLFKEYIESFYVINIRDQYVMSKTYIYSHITNKSNIEYDIDMTKINYAYANKNYAIEDNLIEVIDEATDDIGAAKQYDDMNDESGAKEYRRKYGHIHREKNYMITTKQDSSDEIARFRRLNQSNIEIIEKVKIIGKYRTVNYFIEKIYKYIEKYNYIKFFIKAILKGLFNKEKRNEYINYNFKKKYRGKKLQYKLNFIQEYLFSLAYCKFKTKVYSNEDDVGKENSNSKIYYDQFNFVIPLRYCFGTIQIHEFSYIQKQLLSNSNVKYQNLKEKIMFNYNNYNYFKNKTSISRF